MRVLFFGRLREALGDERQIARVEGETVAGLRRRLADLYPQAADELRSPRARACIGDAVVGETFEVAGHERVEFFPPLSGG